NDAFLVERTRTPAARFRVGSRRSPMRWRGTRGARRVLALCRAPLTTLKISHGMGGLMDSKRTAGGNAQMQRQAYEKELRKLEVEVCHVQEWVKAKGARIIIVFEGRDAAGKGGTIKAITERVSPRVFRTVALPAPSDRQKTQMFMQRYIEHFPAA